MNPKHPFLMLVVVSLVIAWIGGCAKFSTSDKKIAALEEKVSIGMTESQFTLSVPNAELINTTENKSLYAIRVSPPCFICGSTTGFTRSFESYATRFTFENGELVSFSRFLNGE